MSRVVRPNPQQALSVVGRKLLSNFGPGAAHALSLPGYLRYLARALWATPGVLAERNLRPVDRASRGVLGLRHPVTGQAVRVDLEAFRSIDEDEGSFAFGLVREIWFRDLYFGPFELPARFDCVIDLGANRGLFTLLAAAMSDHVVAVEALAKYRAPLEAILRANNLENVTIVNAFIGADAMLDAEGATMVGLGQLVASCPGTSVDLLKIDIEGSEFGLDFGALGPVKRLAMEVHPAWGDVQSLLGDLESAGMTCRLRDGSLRATGDTAEAEFIFGINRAFPEVAWRA